MNVWLWYPKKYNVLDQRLEFRQSLRSCSRTKCIAHGLFYGPSCFREHKTNGRCDALHTCTICITRYETKKDHTCWHVKCSNCKEPVDPITVKNPNHFKRDRTHKTMNPLRVFILKTLYCHRWGVTNQFSMGSKVLTFKTGPITFKDSLCFLPFPLSTFDIKETSLARATKSKQEEEDVGKSRQKRTQEKTRRGRQTMAWFLRRGEYALGDSHILLVKGLLIIN